MLLYTKWQSFSCHWFALDIFVGRPALGTTQILPRTIVRCLNDEFSAITSSLCSSKQALHRHPSTLLLISKVTMKTLLISTLLLAVFNPQQQVSATDTTNNSNTKSSSVRSWLGKLGGGSLQPPKHIKKQPMDESLSDEEENDELIQATFIAETNLPTDLGMFRLRAYRTPQSQNRNVGNEPCVIYSADKPPFGKDGTLKDNVPVRVHDQCFTSEVFRSQRYVSIY